MFKKLFAKKKYTIRPNFTGIAEDKDMMRMAIISQITNDDDDKGRFVMACICNWVYDEKNQKFLSKEDGAEWMAERIARGEGQALAEEVDEAITSLMKETGLDRKTDLKDFFA